MIPVFLQVLPLLSGVMFAVDQIPVKWQWILAFNPMTSVIAGWRWARARRAPARTWARSPSASPSPACCSSSGSPPSARRSRTSRTRSDVGRDRGRLALEEVPPRRVPGGLRDAARDARPRGEAAHAAGAPSRRRRRSGRCGTSRSTCPRGRCSASSDATAPGKSTLLKILTRITAPTAGRAEIRGRVGSLLEVGTGFHPELTGRENIYLNGAILGMKRREIEQRFDDIVEFSGVEKFIDTPVKRYSSGMYVRLAFAVAAHLEPEILLVDEVLAVGDAEFQRRCLGRMEEIGEHRAAPCCSSPTTCRRSRSSATARSCSTAAASSATGRARRSSRTTCRQAARRRLRAHVAGRTTRRVTTSCASARSVSWTTTARRRTSSTSAGPSGSRSGSRCSRQGEPLFPKIKVHDRTAGVAFNAMDIDPRWQRAVRARRLRRDRVDPREPAERGLGQRRRGGLLASTRRSSTTTLPCTRPCRSTCTTRARATRRAASSPASGAGSSGRSSSGRASAHDATSQQRTTVERF